jgi:DNA-binding GntR family transcriptional regulator
MTESLSGAPRVYRGAAARLGDEMLRRSLGDHEAVCDAIAAGDSGRPAEAMVRHIVETAIDFRLLTRQELFR